LLSARRFRKLRLCWERGMEGVVRNGGEEERERAKEGLRGKFIALKI
jgi:hypothetical protein